MEKITERREATDDVYKKRKPVRVAVLFEVTPRKEGHEEYLRLAGALKSELEGMPGFISAERFSSLKEEGKLLSLSLWENEEAAAEWRRRMNHGACQKRGREALLNNTEYWWLPFSANIRMKTVSSPRIPAGREA